MDLKSSESGVPQSSFLDLSDIKPGVVFQLNQTGTFFFFFFKTMNDTFTEASVWSPEPVLFSCLLWRLHTPTAEAFNLLLLLGQVFTLEWLLSNNLSSHEAAYVLLLISKEGWAGYFWFSLHWLVFSWRHRLFCVPCVWRGRAGDGLESLEMPSARLLFLNSIFTK